MICSETRAAVLTSLTYYLAEAGLDPALHESPDRAYCFGVCRSRPQAWLGFSPK